MATCRGYPTPPVDRHVVDLHSALGQQLFDIAIGESITEIPAHCQHDHLSGEPEAGERRWWREDRTKTADAVHAPSMPDDVFPLCNCEDRRVPPQVLI